jgi:uncharacterized RDD family membrane protein YckC
MSSDPNPYQAPVSESLEVPVPRHGELAGKWRRFLTFVIDTIIHSLCLMVLVVLFLLAFGDKGLAMLEGTPDLVLSLTFYLAYYLFFEGLWARTPAKFILGTVVTMEDGSRPSWGQIFKRTASRFIPFEPFSFLGESAIGWHDSISRTRVIRTRP